MAQCDHCNSRHEHLEQTTPDFGANYLCPWCLKKLLDKIDRNNSKYRDKAYKKELKIIKRFNRYSFLRGDEGLGWGCMLFFLFVTTILVAAKLAFP